MTVTRDDIHQLDQKLKDHKLEVYKTMTETVAGPMNDLTSEIREMTGEFRGVKESTGRLSKEITDSLHKIQDINDRLIKVEVRQASMLGITGKLLPYFIALMVALIPTLLGVNMYIS